MLHKSQYNEILRGKRVLTEWNMKANIYKKKIKSKLIMILRFFILWVSYTCDTYHILWILIFKWILRFAKLLCFTSTSSESKQTVWYLWISAETILSFFAVNGCCKCSKRPCSYFKKKGVYIKPPSEQVHLIKKKTIIDKKDWIKKPKGLCG